MKQTMLLSKLLAISSDLPNVGAVSHDKDQENTFDNRKDYQNTQRSHWVTAP